MHAHGLFEMAGGVIDHFEACLAPYHGTGVFGDGWDEFIQIDGTKGRIEIYYPRWDRPKDFSVKCRIYREAKRSWEEPEFGQVDVFRLEMEAFAGCCSKGRSAQPSIREAARVDFWIDACYESARSHQTVPFPPDLR
jgi:predicted dehydrogenase